VLLGTLYPLLLEALTGEKISVGPPFFNLTFGPLMIPLLLAVPFGPVLATLECTSFSATGRHLAAAIRSVSTTIRWSGGSGSVV
jgi:cytochrome c-type biogenesis protein CcmF